MKNFIVKKYNIILSSNLHNGWLNLYKPKNISSARAVALIKHLVKPTKVGHAGTLDLEAEGILPIAIGEATKLTSILMQARKKYHFTIQFGTKTDSADAAGKIIEQTTNIPSKQSCLDVCNSFIGKITQIPPAYSALKVKGRRAYDIARSGGIVTLPSRQINIYELKLLSYNGINNQAKYSCICSKGTYIRTLAEDISFSLQTLGFVLILSRLQVGNFTVENAVNIGDFEGLSKDQAQNLLLERGLKIEEVLDDIPALEATNQQEQMIKYGQECRFDDKIDLEFVWIKNQNKLIAIGRLQQGIFNSSRVFNL